MPDAAPAPPGTRQLRRGVLSQVELAAQAVAGVAPTGAAAVVVPAVLAVAGSGTWLVYVAAGLITLLVARRLATVTGDLSSPGALYTFVGRELGNLAGVVCAWAALLAYLLLGAAALAGTTLYVRAALDAVGGDLARAAQNSFLMFAVAAAVWGAAYRGVRLSARLLLVCEVAALVLVVGVAAAALGASGPLADPAQLRLRGASLRGLGLSLGLGVLSYTGFESAAVLGREARQARRQIGRAMTRSVVGVCVFFVGYAYALTAVAHRQSAAFAAAPAPLTALAAVAGVRGAGTALTLAVSLSGFAGALACVTAGGRVLFAMAHQTLLPPAGARVHFRYGTPHVAVTAVAAVTLMQTLTAAAAGTDLLTTFAVLGTAAVFGFLVIYGLVTLATVRHARRQRRLRVSESVENAATLMLLAVPVVSSVYPTPPAPLDRVPFAALALLGLAVAHAVYVRTRRDAIRWADVDDQGSA